jgi:ion channel
MSGRGSAPAAIAGSVRTRGSGHYEVVLVLVVVVIALTPLDSAVMRPMIVALLSGAFIFSFWTSGVSTRALTGGSILAAAGLLVGSAGQLAGGGVARGLFAATGIALTGGAEVAIFHHLAAQDRVTRNTVTGALTVYLLNGLMFAYLYSLIAVIGPHGFFAQSGDHGATDFVYFSYVTLTTVGYGDLTAASNFGRVVAVLEALIGQLYLVTIVAVVVGNIGRERSGHLGQAPEKQQQHSTRGE